MNSQTSAPTRAWYARKLTASRYQVTCKHLQDGFEEDCGTTLPDSSREDVLEWLVGMARPHEAILINDTLPRQEYLS